MIRKEKEKVYEKSDLPGANGFILETGTTDFRFSPKRSITPVAVEVRFLTLLQIGGTRFCLTPFVISVNERSIQ